MAFADFLTQTATIQRPTTTADASGGQSKSFATLYASVPCLLQPHSQPIGARDNMHDEFAHRSMRVSHVMFTSTAVSLQAGDRVVVSSINYNVHGWGDMGGQGRVYQIYLERKD